MKRINDFPISIVKKTATEYNKAFHAKLFTLFASSVSEIVQLGKDFSLDYDYCFCFLNDEQGQWYVSAKSLEKVRNYIIKQAEKNPKNIIKYYEKWQKYWKVYQKLNTRLVSDDFSVYSDKQLYKKFNEYYGWYLKVGGVAYICDSFMSSGETDWLQELMEKELKKKYSQKIKEITNELISPTHLSFVLVEEFNLLKIASLVYKKYKFILPKFNKLDKNLLGLLNLHEGKFYWMKNNYYNVEFYSVGQAYSRICKLLLDCKKNNLDVHKLYLDKQTELKIHRKNREKLIKNIDLSKSKKNIIKIANLFSQWKDVRKSGVYMGMTIFDKFLEEIASRTDYSKKDLTFTVFPEIENILLKKANLKREIKSRKEKIFFAVKSNGGYVLESGSRANKYYDLILKEKNTNMEFKGVTACKGLAKGKVHLVLKTEEMNKFKNGEILVTNNTTPEFVPIMKKASAIITEQGGITSHAAVVSREINKPCIIGVKGITEVLQNKQLVKVDADHGIITIIK